jgi:outer membrane receptor protein involved in Fe transport
MRIEKPKWTLGLTVVFATVVMLGFSLPAMAQEEQELTPEQQAAMEQAMERSFEDEITVTGSLIPRVDLEALSPVTTLEVEQELIYSGVNRIEDLVVSLPQVFSSQNSTIANGASGMATIDLRNLGVARTLVLVNGIPAALVKRVDVLTGGASTVYGSDAVAGVVNFIMDTDFEGFRGGLQYSFYQHDNNNQLAQQINEEAGFTAPSGSTSDGDAINAYFSVGGKFADGKGHAVGYVTYRKINEILKGYRDYVNCSVADGENGPECGGSSNSAQGRFIAYNADGTSNEDYLLHWVSDGGDGHSFRPRTGEVYNYGEWNHLQRPDEKFTAGAFAHYTVNDHFEPYLEVMAMTNYTDAQIAPSGSFGEYNFINCDNPLLSEQQRVAICGPGTGWGPTDLADVLIYRRNVEGGNRSNALGHDNLRLVTGVRGDINDQWNYDFYYLHAQNNSTDVYNNDLSIELIGNALDVISDPDTGEPVCRNDQANCVPWNIFQEGAVTQEALDYIDVTYVMTGRVKTDVANLTFTSDWEDYGVILPGASEGLALAVGAEYRYEWLENFPDEIYNQGGATGQGSPAEKVGASFEVKELFLELALPLIQDRSLFKDLSLELGYRYSDWSTSGGFNTYKMLVNWAFNDSIRIRGGYNRAVRGPNIWDLFQPQAFGLQGQSDICATENPAATLEQCLRTGMTEAQYGTVFENPADQYNNYGGGNPELTPETADTITAGVVWTPQSIAGLSVTLDYYDIDITDVIGALSPDDIIQQCANTGDPALCDLIHRDRFGTLWFSPSVETGSYTENLTENLGGRRAEGVDLNANYMIGLGNAGYLPIDLNGSYLMTWRFTDPLVDYDCVGYFGFQCAAAKPQWRHRLRATWEMPFNLNLSLGWRYLGQVEIDDASPDPDIGNPSQMENWRINGIDKIGAHNWFDLAASYLMNNGIRFTVGVNNIFDEEPPLAPTFNDDFGINLYATYDALGRYVFGSVQFQF